MIPLPVIEISVLIIGFIWMGLLIQYLENREK